MRRVSIPIAGGGERTRSSGTNNPPIPALTARGQGDEDARQASTNNNGWNRPLTVPQSLGHPADEGRGMQDRPWRLFEERVRTGPYGLTRFPSQPHSPIRLLILDDGLAHMVNPSLQQFIRSSPPRVMGEWQMGFTPREEEPGLTEKEYKKAMSKLRKHIFSPTYPRRRAWKKGLFSRGHNTTNAQEEEDADEGRECTICLDAFVPNQQVLLTPCNHMFHSECIAPWVKSHGKCPVCRYALVERRESTISTNNANNTIINDDEQVMEILALIRAMEEAFMWVEEDR